MFGLFRKKNNVDSLPLFFKSNIHAFSYACKYCNTSLAINNPVVGIVVYSYGPKMYVVKLANPEDESVPCSKAEVDGIPVELRKHLYLGTNYSKQSVLESGDLVMVVAGELTELDGLQIGGIIVAKIKPEFSIKHQGWKLADA